MAPEESDQFKAWSSLWTGPRRSSEAAQAGGLTSLHCVGRMASLQVVWGSGQELQGSGQDTSGAGRQMGHHQAVPPGLAHWMHLGGEYAFNVHPMPNGS